MPALVLETYGKAVIVKGDTRAVKDFLKEKGGKWNKGLTGWIFPGSKRDQLHEDMKAKGIAVEDRTSAKQGGEGGKSGTDGQSNKRSAAEAGGVADEAPKAKAAKTAEAAGTKPAAAKAESEGAETMVEVTDKIRCTINVFMGQCGVDIRRYYNDKDSGEMKPSPKGIRLKQSEWPKLCGAIAQIDAACDAEAAESVVNIEDITVSIKPLDNGGGKSVDIRRYYKDRNDGEMKPTKKGIFLSALEWQGLKKSADEISAAVAAGGSGNGAGGSAPKTMRQAPAPKAAAAAGSSPDLSGPGLRARLSGLLEGRDLQTLSLKVVRGELEASLGLAKGGLDSRKEEIKGIVTDLLRQA